LFRDQVVTGIAVTNTDDFAKVTQVDDFFEQNDLHDDNLGLFVVVGVGQQGQEARALDGRIELALEVSFGARQARRDDLAVFLDEITQSVEILVVDLLDARSREAAELAALEQRILLVELALLFAFSEVSHDFAFTIFRSPASEIVFTMRRTMMVPRVCYSFGMPAKPPPSRHPRISDLPAGYEQPACWSLFVSGR